MLVSFPIDDDHDVEAVFVRFLGEFAVYADCRHRSKVEDGVDLNGLSAAERLAIWIYSSTDSDFYARINGELWSPPCSAEVSEFSEILHLALRKLPAHDGITYRGYNAANFDDFLDQFEPGITIRWPGFTSSTLDRAEAYEGNVLFIIRSHNGRILGLYADDPGEREVLFPGGTRFQVLSVERDDDAAVIELEEVPA